MSQTLSVTCDICGTRKGETNHWWTACLSAGRLCLTEYEPSDRILPTWDLCSEQCLNRLVGKWMRGELQ